LLPRASLAFPNCRSSYAGPVAIPERTCQSFVAGDALSYFALPDQEDNDPIAGDKEVTHGPD
jgi:hypothetical protein